MLCRHLILHLDGLMSLWCVYRPVVWPWTLWWVLVCFCNNFVLWWFEIDSCCSVRNLVNLPPCSSQFFTHLFFILHGVLDFPTHVPLSPWLLCSWTYSGWIHFVSYALIHVVCFIDVFHAIFCSGISLHSHAVRIYLRHVYGCWAQQVNKVVKYFLLTRLFAAQTEMQFAKVGEHHVPYILSWHNWCRASAHVNAGVTF